MAGLSQRIRANIQVARCTSLFGGRGTIIGTLIGALIIGVVRNGRSADELRGRTRTPILSARSLHKRYGNVTALDGADFELYDGEILAVIGDNGAGKSSLIKALSGATIPDTGTVSLDGEEVHFKSPHETRPAGIETEGVGSGPSS